MSRLFIELYVDEDVDVLIAQLLRVRGFIVVTTQGAGQLRNSEAEQLAYAVSQHKTLLTHNRVDFEALTQTYVAAGQPHDGIILAVRRPPREIARRLRRILNAVTASALTVPETTTQDEVLLKVLRETFHLPNIPTPHEVVLFFRTQEFDHLATGHWWLSPTPETPSLGFGGIFPHAVLWGHLRHRPSGQEVMIFNTHLDRHCPLPMAALCCEQIAAVTHRDLPCIFLGDFNVTPTHDAYALLTGDGWHDAHVASASPSEATHLDGRRIDHIFLSVRRGDAADMDATRLS
jgi:hypothetical protein